jgi:hypothetical protein
VEQGYFPRPFFFGCGCGQASLDGGFFKASVTLSSQLPGRASVSGFGPRFRGGFRFDLAPIISPYRRSSVALVEGHEIPKPRRGLVTS